MTYARGHGLRRCAPGTRKPKFTPEQDRAILLAHRAGASRDKLARKYKCSVERIIHALWRAEAAETPLSSFALPKGSA